MILKPNYLEPEIDQNVILKFSLIISLVYNKDRPTDIEAPVPASVSHHCLLSCTYIRHYQCDETQCHVSSSDVFIIVKIRLGFQVMSHT